MNGRKAFKDLEFRDAFMFTAVMEDAELCRKTLERILDFPIRKVRVHAENQFFINSDYRGVRLDVYADDEENTVYDVEFQTSDKKNLSKRCRLNQAHMDSHLLKTGEDFNRLPDSYVIFICTFDPFGRGRYRYTFRETCMEDGKLLEDGTCKMILNTKGTNPDEVPPELVAFLAYAEHSSWTTAGSDPLLQQLETKIGELKRNSTMEERYMLLAELLKDECKIAHDEGRAEGREEGRAEERANTEAQRKIAEEERRQKEEERKQKEEERKRADAAEAEVARLKAQLAKQPG